MKFVVIVVIILFFLLKIQMNLKKFTQKITIIKNIKINKR